MRRSTILFGVMLGALGVLSIAPSTAQAQGPATPPPPEPTVIPLEGYERAVNQANAQAQAAGSKLAQAQAEYSQAQTLAAQANAKLAEVKQARERQLLEQSVTLATQAKDLAEQSLVKVAAAERLLDDAQAQLAEQSALNVALVSDLKSLRIQFTGTVEQLTAAQRHAEDLRGQIKRNNQHVSTLIVLLSFSLIVAAVMALVMLTRTRQAQELWRVAATEQTPAPAPAPASPPVPATVIDEDGTLLYEEPEVDEELSLMLANVFRPNPSPSGA